MSLISETLSKLNKFNETNNGSYTREYLDAEIAKQCLIDKFGDNGFQDLQEEKFITDYEDMNVYANEEYIVMAKFDFDIICTGLAESVSETLPKPIRMCFDTTRAEDFIREDSETFVAIQAYLEEKGMPQGDSITGVYKAMVNGKQYRILAKA